MKFDSAIYDLHITVDPDTLDISRVMDPWKVLDIQNVQGMPHCIVSRKYTGNNPLGELNRMVEKLRGEKALVRREKIELHLRNSADATRAQGVIGIVEIHYKYKQRGVFSVSAEQVEELNGEKLALSFNAATGRLIVSARFSDLSAYEQRRAPDELPPFIEEEEREIVVFDTNNELDSFWPLRTSRDPELDFTQFPRWILRE